MCGIPSSRNGSDFWINPTFSYNSFAYTCASILIVFALNSSLAVLIASLTILVPNPQRLFFAMILPMDASSKVVPGGRIRAYA